MLIYNNLLAWALPLQRRDRTGFAPVNITAHAVLGYGFILALITNNVKYYLYYFLN